ncbi:MAG: PLP-dependent aminotransferase family protein [Pseudorhizobium sp.]
MQDYRAIADGVAEEIALGNLRPGERLPPQREFAFQRGIAASTAARVYAELGKRGLVTGEVGRGTFVRLPLSQQAPALSEPAAAALDLELNFPILDGQAAILRDLLTRLLRTNTFDEALRPIGATATQSARVIAANFLARGTWRPAADSIVFTGNGRQAIAAALAALAPPGSRLGVEALTYPIIKGLAARLGITLVPLACDEDGMQPDAILRAHGATPLSGIYVQPSLHNPLGTSMSTVRRQQMAAILKKTDLIAIEDGIYSFLVDEEPLATYAPQNVVLVDSLSKRVAPGTTLGIIAAPPKIQDRIAASVRSGAWSAMGLSLAIGLQSMADGTAHRLGGIKRRDAKARQAMARQALAGLQVGGDPRAYHLWVELPNHWRAEAFATQAARRGIAIVPASAFAVLPGHAPNAVRLALSSPPMDLLATGLDVLKRLAASQSDQFE